MNTSQKPFRWLNAAVLLAIPAVAIAQSVPSFRAQTALKASDLQALSTAVSNLQTQVNQLTIGQPKTLGGIGAATTTIKSTGGAGFLSLAPGGSGVGGVSFTVSLGDGSTGDRVAANSVGAPTSVVFMPKGGTVTVNASGVSNSGPVVTLYWYPFGGDSTPTVTPGLI
jgi:hypothetical protein